MNPAPCLTRVADVAPQPWSNGGGATRELLRIPDDDDWALRLSLADIERDGPFSAFPGTQRWFAVVQGEGVTLRFGNHAHVLTPDSPALLFDGAAAPHCSLTQGATRDLNLMLRGPSGTLQRAAPGRAWDEEFDQRGFLALSAGELHDRAGAAMRLAPLTLAWGLARRPWLFTPHGPGPCGWWVGASGTQLQGAS